MKSIMFGNKWAVIMLLFPVGALILCLAPSPVQSSVKDVTATLTIITGVALGIERILEVFWTILSLLDKPFWPLNVISAETKLHIDELNATLKIVSDNATGKIQTLKAGTAAAKKYLKNSNRVSSNSSNYNKAYHPTTQTSLSKGERILIL